MTSTIQATDIFLKGTGNCVCGAITISTDSMSSHAGACHCDTCRNWGGGPMMTVECKADVSFSGDENIATYDSSDWAERGFCKQCGTHLFYRLKHNQHHYMPIGLFDKEAELTFDHQVFIDQKPDYYAFSNSTKNMTGEELFALAADE